MLANFVLLYLLFEVVLRVSIIGVSTILRGSFIQRRLRSAVVTVAARARSASLVSFHIYFDLSENSMRLAQLKYF